MNRLSMDVADGVAKAKAKDPRVTAKVRVRSLTVTQSSTVFQSHERFATGHGPTLAAIDCRAVQAE